MAAKSAFSSVRQMAFDGSTFQAAECFATPCNKLCTGSSTGFSETGSNRPAIIASLCGVQSHHANPKNWGRTAATAFSTLLMLTGDMVCS